MKVQQLIMKESKVCYNVHYFQKLNKLTNN